MKKAEIAPGLLCRSLDPKAICMDPLILRARSEGFADF
jgi:hypothetical protein